MSIMSRIISYSTADKADVLGYLGAAGDLTPDQQRIVGRMRERAEESQLVMLQPQIGGVVLAQRLACGDDIATLGPIGEETVAVINTTGLHDQAVRAEADCACCTAAVSAAIGRRDAPSVHRPPPRTT